MKQPSKPTEDQPTEELIDETNQDSFPASDPPSWNSGRSNNLLAPNKEATSPVPESDEKS